MVLRAFILMLNVISVHILSIQIRSDKVYNRINGLKIRSIKYKLHEYMTIVVFVNPKDSY